MNVEDLLELMLREIKKQNKKVLVVIDEVANNVYMKQFVLSFQMFIRNGYPIVLLATGLYENISSLENEKNVTFLIRSPKIYLSPLNINEIAASYETALILSRENALKCAELTKGYAFAFQLLGYILYEQKAITPKVLSAFDLYLSEYVYTKIW